MTVWGPTPANAPLPHPPAPYLEVELNGLTPPVGVPAVLDLDPWAPKPGPGAWVDDAGATHLDVNPEHAHSPDGLILLTLSRGFDQTTLDTGPFNQATVTIVAMPAQDGDALTIRVQLHFSDVHTLDQTYSGPVPPIGANGCAAG
jgi:hypothetical protein